MRYFIVFLMILLSGCSQYRELFLQQKPDNFPSRFSLYSTEPDADVAWWQELDSPELNRLITLALADNFTIKEARARLEQARCKAIMAGAYLYPELNGGSAYFYEEQQRKGTSRTSDDTWSLEFTAGYEVDLWQRVRAGRESRIFLQKASAEDLRAAQISVSSEICRSWINYIAAGQQLTLLTTQLDLQKKLLRLIVQRFPLAKSTALDIYQQQQLIEKIKEAMIPARAAMDLNRHRLALLTGRSTLPDHLLKQGNFPNISPVPAIGLPADLLAARPDIKAAGLRLKSTEWEIAAAKADRLPTLRLTASYNAYSPDNIASIFDNWLLNLAANLTGPIFDGGRRRAEVKRVKAEANEHLALYGRTVFTAIKEVEDMLTQEDQQRRTLISLNKQFELSNKTTREARRRYLYGNTDFLNVLQQELNSVQLQHDIISSREKMIIARIGLHRALGGR